MTLHRSVIEEHERMIDDEIEELLQTPMGLVDGERWSVERENVRQLVLGSVPEAAADPFAEAIVKRHRRPSLLIRNGRIEVPRSRIWRRRLLPHRDDIERAIPGVGRIEFTNVPEIDYVGTGWLIDEDLIVTNRHVAALFAERARDRFRYLPVSRLNGDIQSREQVSARIDFREEFGEPEEHNAELGEVLWIEDAGPGLPDLALIRLRHPLTGVAPLIPQTSLRDTDYVGVIGYPARDHRATPGAMDQVFGDVYDKKRFAPGLIMGRDGPILRHDCSTLGGNSGSPVIDVDTGNVVALHFGGREGVGNNAVSVEAIVERLVELNRRIRVGGTFSEVMAAPDATDDADDALLEQVDPAFSSDELWKRTGYQPAFLSDDPDHEVPFPLPPAEERGHLLEVRKGMAGPRRYLLPYEHYSVAMHARRKLPICTAVNIDGDTLRRLARNRHAKPWANDPRVPDEHQIDNRLYRHNSLDRGHMVRRLDPAWGDHVKEAILANKDTFFYTNCAPQHQDLNQGIWLKIEDHVLDELESDRAVASVFSGPVFGDGDLVYRGERIPERFWKVVAFLDGDGDLRSGGFLLSQDHLLSDVEALFDAFVTHQVPVAEIQELVGLDFGPLVDADGFPDHEAPHTHRRIERLEDLRL